MAIGEELAELPAPGPGDRVAFMANTGEGKSYLADQLLAAKPNVIILNTKHDDEVAFATNKRGVVKFSDSFMHGYEGGRIEFRPPDAWMDSMAEKDRFFMWAFNWAKKNRTLGLVIYIDEANDICPSAVTYPRKLQKCTKQGRAINLAIWCSAQEPVRAPSFLFGQSQHRYVFHLGWDPHRKSAEEWFQQKIPWDALPEGQHKFLLKTPQGVFGPMKL